MNVLRASELQTVRVTNVDDTFASLYSSRLKVIVRKDNFAIVEKIEFQGTKFVREMRSEILNQGK